jgi:cytochrome c peroxidase
MNRKILLAMSLCIFSTPLFATEIPTVKLGEKLFNANNLGTNGKSCATCHPDGEGLHEIDAYDDGMLKEMVNFCIRDAMKGRMMDLESTEIESFLMYLRKVQEQR